MVLTHRPDHAPGANVPTNGVPVVSSARCPMDCVGPVSYGPSALVRGRPVRQHQPKRVMSRHPGREGSRPVRTHPKGHGGGCNVHRHDPDQASDEQPACRRLVEAPTHSVSEYGAALRLSGDRGADHDHPLLPVLRGGRRYPSDAALLPHVVSLLPVPPGGVQRHRCVHGLHRRTVRQDRPRQSDHLRHAVRGPHPTRWRAQHPQPVRLRRRLLRDRLCRRHHPRVHARTHQRLLASDGTGLGHGVLGSRADHRVAGRQHRGHADSRPPPPVAGPVHHLRGRVHGGGRHRVRRIARALAPTAGPAHGVGQRTGSCGRPGPGPRYREGHGTSSALHAPVGPHRLVTGDLGLPVDLLRIGQRPHVVLGGDLQPHDRRCQRHQHLVLGDRRHHPRPGGCGERPPAGPQAVHAPRRRCCRSASRC